MTARSPVFYLEDILEEGEKVARFIEGYTEETFLADERTVYAVIRCFEVIGEAANKISRDIQSQFPQIPWAQMIGFRNFLIHEYLGISLERLWESASVALPNTLPTLKAMHQKLAKG